MDLDQTLERPGCTLRFHDAGGDGQPVVLLHGAGLDHQMFRHQASALTRAGLRPIQLDLRGHGRSRPADRISADLLVADLEALIDDLALDRPVLAGLSLGGNVAQELVRRRPERHAGMVVLDSTWNAGPVAVWERWALGLAGPMLRLVPRSRLPRMLANASAETAETRAELEATFGSMSREEFIAVFAAAAQFVSPDPSARTAVPLLLAHGAADRTGNIARAMSAWAQAEQVALSVVPDAGHVITLDAPAMVDRLLLDFCEQLRP